MANRRGEDILGSHPADFLSTLSNAEVLTMGSYSSNGSYMRFYQDNQYDEKHVLFGYSNGGARLWSENNAPVKLDVQGSIATSNLRSIYPDGIIDVTGTSFYGVSNLKITGTILNATGNPLKLGGGGVTDFEIIRDDVALLDPDLASIIDPTITSTGVKKTFTLLFGDTGVEPDPFNQKFIYTTGSDYEFDVYSSNLDGSCNIRSFQQLSPGIQEFQYIWTTDKWSYVSQDAGAAALSSYNIVTANQTLTTDAPLLDDHVLFNIKLVAGARYLINANLPFENYGNNDPTSDTWANLGLFEGIVPVSSNAYIQSVPFKTMSLSSGNSVSINFFVDMTEQPTQNYNISIFGGDGDALQFSASAQLSVITLVTSRGLGTHDKSIVRRSIQCNPLKHVETIESEKTVFVLSIEGNFEATPQKVDFYVNGVKYVYLSSTQNDYDVTYTYNTLNNTTTFTLTSMSILHVSDIVDITVWPTAALSDYYTSGYFYQNVTSLFTSIPWLHVDPATTINPAIRTAKDVVIDGDVYVRGQVYTSCNTLLFPGGISYDTTLDYANSNVFGTTNLIDGAVTPQKMNLNDNLLPVFDAVYDIGSPEFKWSAMYTCNLTTHDLNFTGQFTQDGVAYQSSKWTQYDTTSNIFYPEGNVGIGVSSIAPGNRLQVGGPFEALTLKGDGSNLTNLQTGQLVGQVSVANGGTGTNTLTANRVLLGNGSSAVIAQSDLVWETGRLGIGTTPSASETNLALHVNGNVRATTFIGSGASITALPASVITGTLGMSQGGIGTSSFAANKILIGNGTGIISAPDNLHWDGTNLGIGTSAPTAKLQVAGIIEGNVFSGNGSNLTNLLTSRLSGQVAVGNGGTGTNTLTQFKLLVGAGTGSVSTPTDLHWSGTDAVPAGNLGIGTASPTQKLHVNGKTYISTSLGVGATPSDTAGDIRATNDITAFYSSDRRLKNNIIPIPDALSKVRSINGVSFDWCEDYIQRNGGEDGYFVRRHDVGVIAQELEAVMPEVVADRADGFKAVKYDRIVALLIEAVKELSAKVDALTS